MKRILTALVLWATACGVAFAENLEGVENMICAAGLAQICLETGDCYSATAYELDMPDFVLIDTKKEIISTTKASGLESGDRVQQGRAGGGYDLSARYRERTRFQLRHR